MFKSCLGHFSATSRVNQGRCLTAFEVLLYMMFHTGFLVATAVCLWHPKEKDPAARAAFESMCNDPYTVTTLPNGFKMAVFDPKCTNLVNVFGRYTHVLQLYFSLFVIQWFRCLLYLAALCGRSKPLARLYDWSALPLFLYGLAILVVLHVFRFEPSGKYVAGDYQTAEQKRYIREQYFQIWDASGEMPESGQVIRGTYLLALVVYVWAGGFLLLAFQSLIACCHFKRYPAAAANEAK